MVFLIHTELQCTVNHTSGLVISQKYFNDWAHICLFRKIQRIIWPHRCHNNNSVSSIGREIEGRVHFSANFDVLHETRLKFYAEVWGNVEQTDILDVFHFLISLKRRISADGCVYVANKPVGPTLVDPLDGTNPFMGEKLVPCEGTEKTV